MMFQKPEGNRRVLMAILLIVLAVQLTVVFASAQNLGNSPQFDKTVQGQNANQVEGALMRFVNWIGNVICPLAAALFVVMAVVSYTHGRGVMRWALAAAGMLAISSLTRLLEYFITSGNGGIH